MSFLLRFVAESLFTVYSVSFLLYHRRNFLLKRNHLIFFLVSAVINWSFSAAGGLAISSHFGALALLLIVLLELKGLYQMNPMQLLFESGYFVAVLYWGRGIVLPVFALILNHSEQWVRQDKFYYPIAWILSLLVILVYNLLFRHFIAPKAKVKTFYRSNEQIRFVAIFQVCLLGYLLFINLGRYYAADLPWYNMACIISCIICFAAQGSLVYRGIKTSSLLKYELHTELQQQQLERQLRHYKAYQKYAESFQAFKQDYTHMITSVKSLLSIGEYQKAISLLDTIHEISQKQVPVQHSYSNNILLNALLQDTAARCEEQSTQFSANVYLPIGHNISETDIVRMFTNLFNNAAEACAKVTSDSERFIAITSRFISNNGWLKIETANSFHGKVVIRNGIPESTKPNRDFHGLGLSIIDETATKLGGIMVIDVDQKEMIFRTTLLLPVNIQRWNKKETKIRPASPA
ncbi:sensor histidine kinase [Lacrimispora sp.]|uniref:sensor histidine kinase n=1 Tax=Lacrimispora sp. TaxID=2719234 RepID=UPI0028AB4332|nr:ATP-binding protein [Lacrimispora sp.]